MSTIRVHVNTFGREMHKMFFLADGQEVHVGFETDFTIELEAGRHELEAYVDCWHGTSHGTSDRFFARSNPVRISIDDSPHTWSVDVGEIKLYMWGASGALVTAARRMFGAPLVWPPNRTTWPVLLDQKIEVVTKTVAPSGDIETPFPSAGAYDDDRPFDVFISHASEDKSLVVRPLAQALQGAGLRVWYDEFELRIGDSLRRKIDAGLARSRFGIVVLSPNFFAKGWPQYELDGLVSGANSGVQSLLPIWHEVSRSEVAAYSPPLSDKVARSTATHSISQIASEIVSVVGARPP